MKVGFSAFTSMASTFVNRVAVKAEKAVTSKNMEKSLRMEKILSIQSTPQEDYNALRDRWTPGTCEGLLSHDKIAAWMRHSASAGILWLHAGPGSGKSIKAAFLIDFLESAGESCQYWYFKHDDALKRSLNVFLRSLTYQVSRDVPTFQMAILKLAEDGAYNGKTGTRQLWKTLFESNLFSMHLEKPLYWVIDAVDEAESANDVISMIKTVPITVPIRIIILSTELPSITTALNRAPLTVPIDSVSVENNQEDIRLFVEREVVYLPGDTDFHSTVQEQLTARAEGSFLWVHLALQELLQIHSQDHLEQILDELPSGMDSMYRRMEASIVQLTKASDRTLSKTLLTWATYGKRPLHIDELLYVLKAKFPSLFDLRTSIAQVCGHFVIVDPSDRVSLIHSTARKYLRHVVNLPFTLEMQAAHEGLLDTCMQTLLDPRLRSKLRKGELPAFCDYASTSWAYHLARVSVDSVSTLGTLVKFFSGPSVLLWIETLAVSSQIGNMIYASATLTRYIERRRRSEAEKSPLLHRLSDLKLLEVWALDLLKVVGKFGDHLLQDPSAINNTIPQLCPQNSALYNQFGKSTFSHISVSGLSIMEWDDLSSRLVIDSSHQASMIRCSARCLAVSTIAKTIMVWHTFTFEKILSLSLDENIFSITLDSLGTRLVSYGPRTTTVWSLPLGQELFQISNEPRIKPLALQFTTDEASLLMCSDTCQFSKLCLEDPTPKWERVFPGIFTGEESVQGAFTNTPASLTFNYDMTHVAIAYRGAPLEIWDLDSNTLISRCKRINRSGPKRTQQWSGVNRVLWHPVDHEVLGLYTDGAVFKWQPLTEAHSELPETPDSTPTDIQISPNGSMFLTSDVNGAVKIHSYHDFVTIYQLSSEDTVTALCFSHDSQCFFDIRGSYCNVWEPNVLIRSSDFPSNDIESDIRSMSSVSLIASEAWVDPVVPITCMVPNAQGDLLCWGDEEGTVILYDIKSDSKLQVATSPVGMGIERIVWSDDGRYLAYEDLGRRVIVFFLTQTSIPKATLNVERVLDKKLNLKGGITQTLILAANPPTIIAFGQSNAQIWNIHRGMVEGDRTVDILPNLHSWTPDPRDPERLFAFKQNGISSFAMDSQLVEPIRKWTINPFTDTGERRINRGMVSSNGQYVMLESFRHGLKSPEVWLFQAPGLDSATETVVAIQLPSSVSVDVERPLNILGSNLFVFIDKSFWICTWRFDFKTLSILSGQKLGDTYNELRDSNTRAKLSIVRHFFLPRDWLNASSLELCTILSDGTFLCPRKGEVAVIRSEIGSEW